MNKEEERPSKNSIFIRIPKRIAFDDNLNRVDKLVLMAICSFINSRDDSWKMSRPAIAERAGYVRVQQIDPSIKKLEKYGYIEVRKGGLRGEEKTANHYRVIFDETEADKPTGKVRTIIPLKRYLNRNDYGGNKIKASTSAGNTDRSNVQ